MKIGSALHQPNCCNPNNKRKKDSHATSIWYGSRFSVKNGERSLQTQNKKLTLGDPSAPSLGRGFLLGILLGKWSHESESIDDRRRVLLRCMFAVGEKYPHSSPSFRISSDTSNPYTLSRGICSDRVPGPGSNFALIKTFDSEIPLDTSSAIEWRPDMNCRCRNVF